MIPDVPPLELLDVVLEPGDPLRATSEVERPVRSTDRRTVATWSALGLLGLLVGASIAAAALRGAEQSAPFAATDVTGEIPPHGLFGFASVYVTTFLSATGAERQAAIEQFYPNAPPMERTAEAHRYVLESAVVDASPEHGARWSLTVGAVVLTFDGTRYSSPEVQHYLVGVWAPADGRMAATGLPMRIAGPEIGGVPASIVGAPVTDQALTALVSEFLRSLVAGGGDIGSFTTATSNIEAVESPPFTRIAIDDMTAVSLDPATLQLRIVGTGFPPRGASSTVEYHLVVRTEAMTWRVAAIASGPVAPPAGEPTSPGGALASEPVSGG